MIEQILQDKGVSRVKIVCDDCERGEVVPCQYESGAPNAGQLSRTIQGRKWAGVKGKHRCPACERKRKVVNMTKPKAVAEAPNVPTREQKRQISELLKDCYDIDAERYQRGDTDETVASVLGVMPGWVAQIREDFFGPDGGNDDIEALKAEVTNLRAELSAQITANTAASKKLVAALEAAQEVAAALDKIKAAVGPRALRAAGVK